MSHLKVYFAVGLCLLMGELTNAGPNSIPTREEQANLLLNVQEIFDEMKKLVHEEGLDTDKAVAEDINRIVERAQDKLELVEELATLKITCKTNKVCGLDAKLQIRDLVEECKTALRRCAERASSDVVLSSGRLDADTETATARAQAFLDALRLCSEKKGLQVVGCYKNVIATDVLPAKAALLRAIEDHGDAHRRTLSIRRDANKCVDDALGLHQEKIAQILVDALTCQ